MRPADFRCEVNSAAKARALASALVCRMHGSRCGRAKGNKNALKHGLYSADAIETRRIVRELTRQARKLIDTI